MKTTTAILSLLFFSLPAASLAADEVSKLFKEAWKKYQDKDYGEVTGKLRDLIRLLEDKTARRVEVVIPERVGEWSGGDLKRTSLQFMGGGLALERAYRHGAKEITLKLVKDSPLGDKLVEILENDDLVALSGHRVHTIHGEKAIVENERKLVMVVNGEIYLELLGDNDTTRRDLLSFARKLDLRAMKKMR